MASDQGPSITDVICSVSPLLIVVLDIVYSFVKCISSGKGFQGEVVGSPHCPEECAHCRQSQAGEHLPGSTVASLQLHRKLSNSCNAPRCYKHHPLQASGLRQGHSAILRRNRWILLIRHASIKFLGFTESAMCMTFGEGDLEGLWWLHLAPHGLQTQYIQTWTCYFFLSQRDAP